MKKFLAALLALTLTLSLAACGAPKEEGKEPDSTVSGDATPTPEVTPTPIPEPAPAPETPVETVKPVETPAETEKPAAKPVEKPASKPAEKPATKPAEKPASKPAEKPATKPVEKPAEKPAAPAVDLAALYTTVSQLGGENAPAMIQADPEVLKTFYAGLSDIPTKQSMAYLAMISAVAAEVALVEVENAADVQKVKDIFQARIDYQVGTETNPGGAWYGATIESWKNNSAIVANGNCVMLVVSEEKDAAVEAFNALFA
ncbi:MAG: DUF4358 domain-containing protein [Oscillibacter sp.]